VIATSPLEDLKYWSAFLSKTFWETERMMKANKDNAPVLYEALRNAIWVMDHIRDEIELPIGEGLSIDRLEEDKQILRTYCGEIAEAALS
jgi:hypothetical protein